MSKEILDKLKEPKTFTQFNFSKYADKLKDTSDDDIKFIYEHLVKLDKIIDLSIAHSSYIQNQSADFLQNVYNIKIDREERINEQIKKDIVPKLYKHFYNVLNSNLSFDSKIIMSKFYLSLKHIEIFNSILHFVISFIKDKESPDTNKLLDDSLKIWNELISNKKISKENIKYIVDTSFNFDFLNIENKYAKNIRDKMLLSFKKYKKSNRY